MFLIATSAVPALAQKSLNQEPVSKGVIDAVDSYRNSIACNYKAITRADVLAMTPLKNEEEFYDAKYAVLWYGDIGCSGGHAVSSNIAIVQFGWGATPVVNIHESTPAANFPISLINRLVAATKDTITVEALAHGPEDANCCPSIKTRYEVKLDNKGAWRVVKKQPLSPKN